MEINTFTNSQLVAANSLPVQAQAEPISDNPAIRLGLVQADVMKAFIDLITAKHGVNIYDGNQHLLLHQHISRPHYSDGSLTISNTWKNRITVREVWTCDDNNGCDHRDCWDHLDISNVGYDETYPETTFWIDPNGMWYPVNCEDFFGIWVDHVTELNDDGTPVKLLYPEQQKQLVLRSVKQVQMMKDLHWFENGRCGRHCK